MTNDRSENGKAGGDPASGGLTRMTERPAHFDIPDLPPNPPVPTPRSAEPGADTKEEKGRDPTRYGDWELKGIAVDF